MIQQPQPFEIPYSIAIDANGNGTYTQQFGNDYWYAATISGDVDGFPTWNVQKNGSFLQPGLGSSVVLPAGTCSPGTKLVITVTGATPLATVSGLIFGYKSSAAQNLPMSSPSAAGNASAVSVTSADVQTLLGTIVAGAGATANKTFPVNTNVQGIGFLVMDLIPDSVTMQGSVSNLNYLVGGSAVNPIAGRGSTEWNGVDPGVKCTVDNTSGGVASTVNFFAYFYNPLVRVANIPGVPVTVGPTPNATIASVNRTGVGSTTLVAGVTGLRCRVFGYQLEYDSGTSGTAVLRDSSGSGVGNRFAVLDAATRGSVTGYYGGGLLPLAAGIVLEVLAIVGGGFSAMVSYNQS